VWAVWHLGKDRFPSKELRERLRTDDITLVLQQNRLQWYRHVLRNEYDDWVKIAWSMKQRVPDQQENQTGQVGEKDCQARKLNMEDATDHSRWWKLIKDV